LIGFAIVVTPNWLEMPAQGRRRTQVFPGDYPGNIGRLRSSAAGKILPRTVRHRICLTPTSLRMLERYGHVRDAAEQQAATAIASHLDGITKRITRDQAQSGK
jgi:hypothetical protein